MPSPLQDVRSARCEADEAYAEGPSDPTKPPTVTAGANADEIVVTRADGTRFIVRRKVRAQVLTRPGRPRAGFCKHDEGSAVMQLTTIRRRPN
ncbi:MAG: hypothetical protein ABI818_09640, partial [Acidobacteriota bacterium]